MSSSTGVFSLFCRLGVIFKVLPREGWLMILVKKKHTVSIFQAQVRDLAKHIEAQPKKHKAYKKKRV